MYLQANGIGSYFHYPPLHQFTDLFGTQKNSFCNSEDYARRAITLPIGPHMSPEDAFRISKTTNNFTPSN